MANMYCAPFNSVQFANCFAAVNRPIGILKQETRTWTSVVLTQQRDAQLFTSVTRQTNSMLIRCHFSPSDSADIRQQPCVTRHAGRATLAPSGMPYTPPLLAGGPQYSMCPVELSVGSRTGGSWLLTYFSSKPFHWRSRAGPSWCDAFDQLILYVAQRNWCRQYWRHLGLGEGQWDDGNQHETVSHTHVHVYILTGNNTYHIA